MISETSYITTPITTTPSTMESHRTAATISTTNNPIPPQTHNPKSNYQNQSSSSHQILSLANQSSQEFCLRWNNYQTNLTSVFDQLLQSEQFVDVTLSCDGHSIKAHKIVLSACSPYFQALFFDNPSQYPIIIMHDIKWSELKAIVEFMYKGETKVNQDQIGPLLRVAEMLKIRGLAEVNQDQDLNASPTPHNTNAVISDIITTSKSVTPNVNINNNSNVPITSSTTLSSSSPTIVKKSKIQARDWSDIEHVETIVDASSSSNSLRSQRKRKWHSTENSSNLSPIGGHETPTIEHNLDTHSPLQSHSIPPTTPSTTPSNAIQPPSTPTPLSSYSMPPALDSIGMSTIGHPDDMEIKPGIAEMIREEERAKLLENANPWLGASTSSLADSYQYQLQSMWQKCWNTNQNLIHHLRFRERGPLKSWRPETMAEAIFSVLKEGLSLSQAARKFDIPYPTFVLYANRVHNMLGPSMDGGTDLRPKGRGRPQRILLGVWPDEHIKNVIKSVVFRDAKDFKDDPAMHLAYGRHSPVYPFQDGAMNFSVPNNNNGISGSSPIANTETLSQEATAAAVAAMAHGIRQQMQMAAAQQHHGDLSNFSLPSHCANLTIQPANSSGRSSSHDPKLESPRQILSNGSISLSRIDSPNSMHHSVQNLSHHHTVLNNMSPDGSPNSRDPKTVYITSSQSSSITPVSSSSSLTITPSHRHSKNPSPVGAHNLSIPNTHSEEDNSSIDSTLEISVEPSVNLAVGVSGLSYKTAHNFTSPRSENHYPDEIGELAIANPNDNIVDGSRTPSRPSSQMSNFKEPPSSIKIEPITSECRGE